MKTSQGSGRTSTDQSVATDNFSLHNTGVVSYR